MPLKKGQTNNPHGRPKGSRNKAPQPLRELLTQFVQMNWDLVQDDFLQLEPKDRLLFFEKLLKYTLPTLQAVNLTHDLEQQLEHLSDAELEQLTNRILNHHCQAN